MSYEGDALSEHMMGARNIGTALIALDEIFERANLLLNGNRALVNLSLRTTQPGSFEVILYLAQMYQVAMPVLTSDMLTSVGNLVNIVIGGNGLITWIKRLRGEKPKSIQEIGGQFTIETNGGRLTMSAEMGRLYFDEIIKKDMSNIAGPVIRGDFSRVSFRQGNEELESITAEQAPYFQRSSDDGKSQELITPKIELTIISPYFGTASNNKWRLYDGHNTNWYSIKDEQFLRDVHDGTRIFAAKDVLICDVKILISAKNDKIQKEFEILRVLNHHPNRYLPLFSNINTEAH